MPFSTILIVRLEMTTSVHVSDLQRTARTRRSPSDDCRYSVSLAERKRDNAAPRCLSALSLQLLAILLSDGNEELIHGHGRINSDFTTKQALSVDLVS